MIDAKVLALITARRRTKRDTARQSARAEQASEEPSRAAIAALEQQRAAVLALLEEQRLKGQKGGWRAAARELAQRYPEEFGDPEKPAEPDFGERERVAEADEEQAVEQTPTESLQCLCPASEPGAAQSDPAAGSVSLPIPAVPPLESAFWQRILYGNPESLVPGSDATRALQSISNKLGVPIADGEILGTFRAGALRKLLWGRFGAPEAERAMHQLWRSAPHTPGTPLPAEDLSHCAPGPWSLTRSQPRWIQDLHRQTSDEQRQLEQIGGWCGYY